jgi:phage terminase Nu1 subunit (DNA packaging protein)
VVKFFLGVEKNKMAKDQNVSAYEFAKYAGVSQALISRLKKSGELPANADGTIPLNAGLTAFKNREKTKAKKTPARAGEGKATKKTKTKKDTKKKKTEEKKEPAPPITPAVLPEDDETETGFAPMIGSAVKIQTQFNKARLAEKTYQAKLREIEYKLKKGELVERAEVVADAAAVAAEVRERLLTIPVRVAAVCERRTARDIEGILTDAINEALQSLNKTAFKK